MITVLTNKTKALLGRNCKCIGTVLIHKLDAILVLLSHDDALGCFEHRAKERANSRRACSDDENSIVLCNFGDLRRPITRGENIAHEPRSRKFSFVYLANLCKYFFVCRAELVICNLAWRDPLDIVMLQLLWFSLGNGGVEQRKMHR